MPPSPRTPLAWLLLPLIAGYLLADFLAINTSLFALLGFALACVSTIYAEKTARRTFPIWAIAVSTSGILLAAAYSEHRMAPPADWPDLPPREANLTIQITQLYQNPDPWNRQRGIGKIRAAPPHLQDLLGQKVHLTGPPPENGNDWKIGQQLHLTGLLTPISAEAAADNDFLKSLVRAGIHFQLNRIAIREPPENLAFLPAFLDSANRRLERILRAGNSDIPHLPDIYVAMLLGKKSALDDDLRQPFLLTGTLHLFAISGLHIGVIALAIETFLQLLRIPERPRIVLGLALLLLFVGITGSSPSAMRAFLMVLCFRSARFCQRSSNPCAALANSAFLVLLLFPDQLWNAGFQLSYTVVLGILFLGVPLSDRLQERWMPFQDIPSASQTRWQIAFSATTRKTLLSFGVSLSATLLSSPLTILYFGIFSPGAVLVNLIMMPLAGLAITAGFISILLGLAGLPILSVLFNHSAWFTLALMEKFVQWAARTPGLFWHGEFFSPLLGGIALLATMIAILLCAQRRWQAPTFHFALPFLVFILFLLLAGRLTFPGG